jgi:hypothetical protein
MVSWQAKSGLSFYGRGAMLGISGENGKGWHGRAFLAGTLETYLIIRNYRLERPSETRGC